jgi:hypothetical protein
MEKRFISFYFGQYKKGTGMSNEQQTTDGQHKCSSGYCQDVDQEAVG